MPDSAREIIYIKYCFYLIIIIGIKNCRIEKGVYVSSCPRPLTTWGGLVMALPAIRNLGNRIN